MKEERDGLAHAACAAQNEGAQRLKRQTPSNRRAEGCDSIQAATNMPQRTAPLLWGSPSARRQAQMAAPVWLFKNCEDLHLC